MSVFYLSHIGIRSGAKGSRLKTLIRDLEAHGCKVRPHFGAQRLDLEISAREERWLVLGGLKSLLNNYQDVATWSPNFTEKRIKA